MSVLGGMLLWSLEALWSLPSQQPLADGSTTNWSCSFLKQLQTAGHHWVLWGCIPKTMTDVHCLEEGFLLSALSLKRRSGRLLAGVGLLPAGTGAGCDLALNTEGLKKAFVLLDFFYRSGWQSLLTYFNVTRL